MSVYIKWAGIERRRDHAKPEGFLAAWPTAELIYTMIFTMIHTTIYTTIYTMIFTMIYTMIYTMI